MSQRGVRVSLSLPRRFRTEQPTTSASVSATEPDGIEPHGRGFRVPFVNLEAQYLEEREEILAIVDGVFRTGQFVGGKTSRGLEADLCGYLGRRHCLAVSSGTDALMLALQGLGIGPGDEVITPPNSFVASTASIANIGATPVFADVGADHNLSAEAIEAAITPHTRAIMPVHLFGRCCDMDAIMDVAQRHGLAVIEDAAQAIGARFRGRLAGSFGDVGCFSGHPLKVVNAAGDAGWIATDDEEVYERIRLQRGQGLKDRDTVAVWGRVARMDTLQSEILRFRLRSVDNQIARRRANAARYIRALRHHRQLGLPLTGPERLDTYNTFVIMCEERDALQAFLIARGIDARVHYPRPIHLQPAAAGLACRAGSMPVTERLTSRTLSLPSHPYLSNDDIDYVVESICLFLDT